MAFQSSYLWFLAILLRVSKAEGGEESAWIVFFYYEINKINCIKI